MTTVINDLKHLAGLRHVFMFVQQKITKERNNNNKVRLQNLQHVCVRRIMMNSSSLNAKSKKKKKVFTKKSQIKEIIPPTDTIQTEN